MKIGVEHAACGEAFNDAQFLNPQQNQRRPDIIEKLNRDEQNPERDFVLLTPSRESNAIMSDKHFRLIIADRNRLNQHSHMKPFLFFSLVLFPISVFAED